MRAVRARALSIALCLATQAAACGGGDGAAPSSASADDEPSPKKRKKKSTSAASANASTSASPPAATAAASANTKPTAFTPLCGATPCPCKAGTSNEAKETYDRCELEAQLTVQGVPCGPGRLLFHPDGRLAQCEIAGAATIGSIKCSNAGFGFFQLHENGTVKQCTAEGPTKVGDFELAAGAFRIQIFEDGTLRQGTLAAPRDLFGVKCTGDVVFYRGGRPYSCRIDEPVELGGHKLEKNTPVMLAKDGSLLGFFPQSDVTIDGKLRQAGYAYCIVKDCNTHPDD